MHTTTTKPFFLLFLAISLVLTACGPTANAEAEFWARGNCDMCKENIETALAAVAGVAEATYDVESNTVRVAYDSSQTKLADLHAAVAGAGYDTKEATADAAAYAKLAKCCKKPEDQ